MQQPQSNCTCELYMELNLMVLPRCEKSLKSTI